MKCYCIFGEIITKTPKLEELDVSSIPFFLSCLSYCICSKNECHKNMGTELMPIILKLIPQNSPKFAVLQNPRVYNLPTEKLNEFLENSTTTN